MRKLVLILFPLLAFGFAACDDNGNGDGEPSGNTPQSTATEAARTTDVPPATPPDAGASGSASGAALFEAFNPLQLLASAGQPGDAQEADPSLAALLLTGSDLPSDFTSNGDFHYTVPTEYGDVDLAANIFTRGDFLGGNFDAMVMSGAMDLPPEAREELGDPSQLSNLSQADIDTLKQDLGELSDLYGDLRVLDASGLGEGGTGLHMSMNFGAIFEAFGAPQESNPFSGGIAMETYMFVRGDRMLMTMVMWPEADQPAVDGHSLAETMDSRAENA